MTRFKSFLTILFFFGASQVLTQDMFKFPLLQNASSVTAVFFDFNWL